MCPTLKNTKNELEMENCLHDRISLVLTKLPLQTRYSLKWYKKDEKNAEN
jgi:hypothetical protein